MYNRYLDQREFRSSRENGRPPRYGGGRFGRDGVSAIRASLEKRLPFGLDLGDVLVLLILLLLYLDSGDEEFLIILAVLGYQMIRNGR